MTLLGAGYLEVHLVTSEPGTPRLDVKKMENKPQGEGFATSTCHFYPTKYTTNPPSPRSIDNPAAALQQPPKQQKGKKAVATKKKQVNCEGCVLKRPLVS